MIHDLIECVSFHNIKGQAPNDFAIDLSWRQMREVQSSFYGFVASRAFVIYLHRESQISSWTGPADKDLAANGKIITVHIQEKSQKKLISTLF